MHVLSHGAETRSVTGGNGKRMGGESLVNMNKLKCSTEDLIRLKNREKEQERKDDRK